MKQPFSDFQLFKNCKHHFWLLSCATGSSVPHTRTFLSHRKEGGSCQTVGGCTPDTSYSNPTLQASASLAPATVSLWPTRGMPPGWGLHRVACGSEPVCCLLLGADMLAHRCVHLSAAGSGCSGCHGRLGWLQSRPPGLKSRKQSLSGPLQRPASPPGKPALTFQEWAIDPVAASPCKTKIAWTYCRA